MRVDGMIKNIQERLAKLNIYELRQVARAVGVHRPADGKKSRVEEAILSIARGQTMPEAPSLRGAPPKSQQYDEQLVADIKACRQAHLSPAEQEAASAPVKLQVNDGGATRLEGGVCGILEIGEKRSFIHADGLWDDVGVTLHESFLGRYSLRQGDLVEGRAVSRSANEVPALIEVTAVNGTPVFERAERGDFDKLTHEYPSKNVKCASGSGDIACRMIDLFAPVALGQRAFISTPQKSEKSKLLKQIAAGISRNYDNLNVIVLLIDEKPEVITDFKRSLSGAELFYTTFADDAERHIKCAELVFEHAKRLVEEGKNAVVVFDGLTRLERAYKGGGAAEIKKLLFCACNASESGSLTVICTDERAENGAYGEFLPLANMTVYLSKQLAEKRIFPAIDVKASYADGEAEILTADEIKAAAALRNLSAERVLEIFAQTSNNAELVEKFK